ISLGDSSKEARVKASKAWGEWWKGQEEKVSLARLNRSESYQGLRIVAEAGWTGRMQVGRVFALDRSGKERVQLDGLQGPWDAPLVHGGTVLIDKHYARKVSERDRTGKKVIWSKDCPGNPVICQRLPNGNTFIACYNHILEVRRDGKEVFNHFLGPNIYIYA